MNKHLALKLLSIFIVTVLILIPLSMVKHKVYERQGYFDEAKERVASSWTGSQVLMSPVIVIPYNSLKLLPPVYSRNLSSASEGVKEALDRVVSEQLASAQSETHYAFLLPSAFDASVQVENRELRKGIYPVAVYQSELVLQSEFDLKMLEKELEKIKKETHFSKLGQPFISFYIKDMRGIEKQPDIFLNQKKYTAQPGSGISGLSSGLSLALPDFAMQFANANSKLTLDLVLQLRGMESLKIIPAADESKVSMVSNWLHPEFVGQALPHQRHVDANGFKAEWISSRYANNSASLLSSCLNMSVCSDLSNMALGVDFIQAVDVYLQSERAIKYGLLFIGLIFVSFFIFEQLKGVAIHPIQYTFVGFAIAMFYLLLIALSEHLLFIWAYMVAALACVLLLLAYLRYVLKSFLAAVYFSGLLLLLYSSLFVIIKAEDFALLMGAVLVFVILAILMLVTRHIDWYHLNHQAD